MSTNPRDKDGNLLEIGKTVKLALGRYVGKSGVITEIIFLPGNTLPTWLVKTSVSKRGWFNTSVQLIEE